MLTGTIFNIQHFTIHDGPGIRTEIFLKGCPMHCLWCSNPEGIDGKIRPGVYRKRCLGRKVCGLCLQACPGQKTPEETDGPLKFYRGKLSAIDYDNCIGCMNCAEACPSRGIKAWGREASIKEVMEEVRRDKGYYDRSGGGITLSGGEPLLQAEFAEELFRSCRGEGIHTCCESCLWVPWEKIEKMLPVTDLWIADLKMMDDEKHRKYTGRSNERILDNLKKLGEEAGRGGGQIILRIPVIPGVNDTMEDMEAAADFILEEMKGRIRTLQLLSFMRLGMEKYQSLGMAYPMIQHLKDHRFRRDHFQKKIAGYAEYFEARGIHTTVGVREKEKR